MDKIICVGKNYLAHARELGDAIPEQPVIFLKPPSVLKQATHWGQVLRTQCPPQEEEVHPECEIVLQLAKGGYQMTTTQAADAIGAVTLGLDMTLRARQALLKKQGHPWTTAKVFPDAAIIGPWIPLSEYPDFLQQPFSFSIDGEVSQQDVATSMMMQPTELIVYISHFFPLCAGDVIFTGTPAGVSPIRPNAKTRLTWGKREYEVVFN